MTTTLKLLSNKDTIYNIECVANLLLSTVVSINLYYYYYIDKSTLYFSIPFIALHFLLDIFICTTDIKLHHLCGLLVIFTKYFYNTLPIHDSSIIILIYNFEITTFFYLFKIWLKPFEKTKNQILKWVITTNDIVFFAMFFKIRIFDYYIYAINNPIMYENLYNYVGDRIFDNMLMYSGIYGFFILNMYWFLIMCKILCKTFFGKKLLSVDAQINCQHITSLTLFVNPHVAAYAYYNSPPNFAYFFDLVGIINLGFFNYKYHNSVKNYVEKNKQIDYLSEELFTHYVMDNLSIHLRSFLCVVTCLYETLPLTTHILVFVAIMHFYFYYLFVKKLNDCIKNKEQLIYSNCKEKNEFLSNINRLMSIPITVDTLIVAFFSSYYINAINLCFVTVFIAFTIFIQPFYEYSHVAFHAGLLLETYFLASCNLRRIQ
jgi:hypothetical protein